MIAGWINRHQQQVIAYLLEENRTLHAKLRGRRIRFTAAERRRLAALAFPIGRKRLKSLATPDTLRSCCKNRRVTIFTTASKAATQEKDEIGFDGNKQVKGRKRHILVDTLGLIIAVVVTAANVDDRQGFKRLVEGYFADGVKRLRKIWADGGYQASWLQAWVRGLKRTHKIEMEITDHEGKGFQVVPWRWAVERTFSWLLNDRRHSRDYERLPANSEALIQISMIHLLLKRLV